MISLAAEQNKQTLLYRVSLCKVALSGESGCNWVRWSAPCRKTGIGIRPSYHASIQAAEQSRAWIVAFYKMVLVVQQDGPLSSGSIDFEPVRASGWA